MITLTAMPKYEAYKDSGVEWLGEIPLDWKTIQIRYVAKRFSNGTTAEQLAHDESSFMVSRIETISDGNINYSKVGFLKKVTSLTAYSLEQDDFLISHINSYEKIGNSAMYKGEQPLWHGMNLIRISPHSVHHKLFKFILKSELFIGAMKRACKPAINQVSVPISSIKSIRIVIPPCHEQTTIANFLDEKIAKIDEAIAIKQKQIELLKERKQIIIQQAVTQGLDPTVPMKDSGVEWIGKIPAHWQVKRAKYLFNEIDERSVNGDEELLSVSHITGVTPRSEKNVNMFMAEDYSGSKTCEKNDLVFNIMWAWMGALGVSDRRGIVSPSYGVFRAKTENTFNPVFLEYLLKSTNYIEHYNKVSTGLHSSRLRFYGHMFFDMELGYPSFNEQNNIIEYVQKESEAIDKALSLQEQQIDVLKEYKTTLINSAVTGKIKVV